MLKQVLLASIIMLSSASYALAEDNVELKQSILKKISLEKKDNNLVLPLNIKTTKSCSFGDFDAIYFDAQYSSYPLVIFTLEDILSKQDSAFYGLNISDGKHNFINKVVSADGFSIDLLLPIVDKPKILGVFICKDSKTQGLCADKKVISINEVLKTYSIENTVADDFESEDKIYYYSFIILEKDGIVIPTRQMSQDSYNELKGLLEQKFGQSPEITNVINKMKATNYTLGSEQIKELQGEKGSFAAVGVQLPKIQPEQCYKTAK